MRGSLTFLFLEIGRSSATGSPRRSMTMTGPAGRVANQFRVRICKSRTEAFFMCYMVAHSGGSLPDLDLRPRLLTRFLRALDRVPGQFQKRLAFALSQRDGAARVAADAHLRVQRQLRQKMHPHLLRRAAPPAVTEYVDALVAVRQFR